MRLWTIFRYEFGYQLRLPWPWLFGVVLIILSFLMTRDGSLSEVLYADFFLNSPFAVVKTTVFGSLIWLMMAAAIAGDAAARDRATGMHPLSYTTPVGRGAYLGGRFLAALLLNALLLLAVQLGILLGVYLPGVDAALIGPFRPAAFLSAYAIISLPNAVAATAIQFALASGSGRAMAGYFGSFLLVFMGFFVASVLLYGQGLGTLADPIGIRIIVEDIAHLWTTAEKNWRLLQLEGMLLQNRLFWLGIGGIALAGTYLSFRFAHPREGGWGWRKGKKQALAPHSQNPERNALSIPQVPRHFGLALQARQTLLIARTSFNALAFSWGEFALLGMLPLMTLPVLLDQMESRGVPLVPTTINIIYELTGSLSDELSRWVIVPFLIVYFAGELVWREREARMGEIAHSMPGSDWAPLLGKFLGLALMLLLFLCLQSGAGMLAQTLLGYREYEPSLYLKIMLGIQFLDYLLFALLALVLHVVVDQKYIGHLVAVIAFVFIAMASLFGIEHNLLIWGASSGWSYTDMRGFGPSLEPWFWFKGYWLAWALLLAVGAKLLWVRGRKNSLLLRLRQAPGRFRGATAYAGMVAAGAVLLLGGWIFYTTNVRNEYLTTSEKKARQAAYEQRYGRFAASAQPRLSAARLQVAIYPDERRAEIRGTYRLLNSSPEPIDSIHVATAGAVETRALAFDRPASQLLADEQLHYRIYRLETPLQPGDSLQLHFQLLKKANGFSESGIDPSLAANGTYFTNSWLPAIGYQSGRELLNAPDRRAHGLPPRPIIASLYDEKARERRGGGIAFEAVVSTSAEQVAVAPGALLGSWTKGGRRFFHYRTDAPLGGEWAFFSARYAVQEALWTNPDRSGQTITIRLYHQPGRTAQLERMLESIHASLTYYTRHFGPYPYSFLTFVERPGRGTGMHADASMITYAEGFSLWQPMGDEETPDVPFAVVAHELAHQWTVPYAPVEGAPVMSESLAWYYAMKVVETAKGEAHFRRFLSWMHQPYRKEIRRGEPLLRGLDPYMSYRRGPFALYALSEYIGEAQVNRALRRLLEKYQAPAAPLATTLDLYAGLQAETPDSLQYLLHDLFEVNTHWELKVEQATASPTPEGNWQVRLEVQARKLVFDSAGVEREVPMMDWVDLALFASQKGGAAQAPLYRQKHRIHTGRQTLTLSLPEQPARAGLDPYNLLIDPKREDNVQPVVPEQAQAPAAAKRLSQQKKE
ncbi:ABC transporter permease/M1 family aminopeptidase [Cesiribacter andamanensis]|uniref:ABC-type transport system involved in multi-copper enzyme maturation, permease component n=1 Tax=Cesiribacter andamanensis AMV16 TaxID=1279009 RepID=M7N3T0_9BACT|nr:ABC-type transport system involved in multi-copper enzyme maturation, permease component [Cesiribacter andamanensis]EMR03318.1 ABC-type transport system involved in multi-copper enzyme maturation, permease component [Cesiribacter andamanensis AMV16]